MIDAKRVAHLMEKAGYGIGAHHDSKISQRHGDLLGRATRPLQAGDRIACRVVLQQEPDQGDYVGCFFSIEGRPPP